MKSNEVHSQKVPTYPVRSHEEGARQNKGSGSVLRAQHLTVARRAVHVVPVNIVHVTVLPLLRV